MTIAAVYLTAEGVVLGADSTSTYTDLLGKRYYNHAQKLFEIGTDSSLAAVTWGLAGLNVSSYRTLLALLYDSFKYRKPKSLSDVAKLWSSQFWEAYSKSPYMKGNAGLCNPVVRTPEELLGSPIGVVHDSPTKNSVEYTHQFQFAIYEDATLPSDAANSPSTAATPAR